MARKQKVNKTEAVSAFLKTHGGATRGEIVAAMAKQGIKITPSHVGNIKSQLKRKLARKRKPQEAPRSEPVAAEKPAKAGDTITISQVRAVAQTVRAVGGTDRLNDLLGLIREVGGIRKFKDLVEAMTVTEVEPGKIPF